MNGTGRIIFGGFIFLLGLLGFAAPASATDWQPISPQDLALKDNPKEPGADAMILYREDVIDASKATVGGDSVEEYIRIKVFTQEGTKQGHVEIPFIKETHNVPYIAGRTIKPDGTIVKFDGQVLETTVVKANGVKVLAKTFTLPDVQPGCIIEYKYQEQGQPGLVYGHAWQVSQSDYTREAHFKYVPYTGYGSGLRPMYQTYLLPADVVPKEQIDGSYLMVAHDIPGVVDEPMMPPENMIEARVEFFYQDNGAASPTDPQDKYWNHYAKKWDGQLEHFIDKKNALNQEIAKIVSPGDTPEIKLRKIYARVLKIRNLNLEDYKMQKENKVENLKENSNVEDVLNRDYAYNTQINYLFVGLARAAGFEATEVYVAPRNVDVFAPARKEVRQLSDELTWVRAGTKEYYLDPAARYFPFGLLPWYETDAGGVRIDKSGGTLVTTPVPTTSDATINRKADLEVKEDGSVTGIVKVDFTGQQGGLLRERLRKEDEAGRTKEIGSDVKASLPVGATFDITKIANWDDADQPVHVEGTLTIPSLANTAARRMLMPVEMFLPSEMSSFAAAKRVNSVYFHFPYEETDDINFRLPPGYKVESVPQNRKVDLGAVSYELSAVAQNNGVEVKRHLVQKGIIYTKSDYATLRGFFGAVKSDDNGRMVLENAQSAKTN